MTKDKAPNINKVLVGDSRTWWQWRASCAPYPYPVGPRRAQPRLHQSFKSEETARSAALPGMKSCKVVHPRGASQPSYSRACLPAGNGLEWGRRRTMKSEMCIGMLKALADDTR